MTIKFICPNCGKETEDTKEIEVIKDGDLIECSYCHDVLTIMICSLTEITWEDEQEFHNR